MDCSGVATRQDGANWIHDWEGRVEGLEAGLWSFALLE